MTLTSAGTRDVSIVTLVAALIEDARARRASDIHIDPTPSGMRLRNRIDGVLIEDRILPLSIHAELVSRIKILSGLRTDEHFASQDGRFRHTAESATPIDIRVSIMPTYHGENVVLRLLSDDDKSHSLATLGFSAKEIKKIESALKQGSGLILATGPTGSGKTTTLYTLVQMLMSPETSIVTIEDPVEYAIEGARQIQVNPRTGLTFAAGLRSLLRQDPDVIMVGEIRDAETAAMAVNTALTGHLVLSTIHTTDAVTTLPRLLDMKVEPYLLASTFRLAIAQRLVRTLCTACDGEEGAACEECGSTGYRGRVSINEVLEADDALREAILARRSASDLAGVAKKQGMRSMLEDGKEKVKGKKTRMEEVLRAVHE